MVGASGNEILITPKRPSPEIGEGRFAFGGALSCVQRRAVARQSPETPEND